MDQQPAAAGDAAGPTVMRDRLPRDRAGRLRVVLLAFSSVLLVAFISQLPIGLLAGASHDDAWFWWRAESMAAGHWMGDYDRMTLAKGTGYPLFLALVHFSGLSVATAQALLHAAACLLLGAAVHRLSHRPWLAVAVVLATQWHPAAFAWTRLMRDQVGAPQVLFAVAGLLLFLHAPKAGRRGWRWAAFGGLALGWTWTTREDTVWMVPGLLLLCLPHLGAWRDRVERRRLLAGAALFLAVFAGWNALVAATNHAKYGIRATVETRGWAYADALSALQRVRVGEASPFLPVPQRVREAVYAASPAFARLRPQFEQGAAGAWRTHGCQVMAETCGDIAGGWFMWAFRDATADIGEYATAPRAEAFYRAVADEVEAACEDGRLTCVGRLEGLLPPMAAAQWRTFPPRAVEMARLLTWQGIGDGQTSSYGTPAALRAMFAFVNAPELPDDAATLAGFGIPPAAEAPMALRWMKYWIGLGYGFVLPWLWLGGLAAFAWAAFDAVRTRRLDPLLVLAAAGWCLLFARGVMMVLVDMTAFPAIKVHYLQPAYGWLVIAAFASFALLRPVAGGGTRPRAPATDSAAPHA